MTPPRSGRHSRRLPRRSRPSHSRRRPSHRRSRCPAASAAAGARAQPQQPVAAGAARGTGLRDSAAAACRSGTARDSRADSGAARRPSAAADAAGTGVVTAGAPRPGPVGDGRVDQPPIVAEQRDPDGRRADRSAAGVDASGPLRPVLPCRRRRPRRRRDRAARGARPGPPPSGRARNAPAATVGATERRRRRLSAVRPRTEGQLLVPARVARRRRPKALRVTIGARPTSAGRPPSCAPPTASR